MTVDPALAVVAGGAAGIESEDIQHVYSGRTYPPALRHSGIRCQRCAHQRHCDYRLRVGRREDEWSDIDLAFGVANGSELPNVLSDWTADMYEHLGDLSPAARARIATNFRLEAETSAWK
jgi:hypothetical protein